MKLFRLGYGMEHVWIAAESIESACTLIGGKHIRRPNWVSKNHVIILAKQIIVTEDYNYFFEVPNIPGHNRVYIPLVWLKGGKKKRKWAMFPIKEIKESAVNIGMSDVEMCAP